MPGVDLSDVVLPDDLQRALISKVESGQFPSKGAIIEEALRSFLVEEPAQEAPEKDRAAEPRPERLPGPFIEDERRLRTGGHPSVRARGSVAASFVTQPVAGPFPRGIDHVQELRSDSVPSTVSSAAVDRAISSTTLRDWTASGRTTIPAGIARRARCRPAVSPANARVIVLTPGEMRLRPERRGGHKHTRSSASGRPQLGAESDGATRDRARNGSHPLRHVREVTRLTDRPAAIARRSTLLHGSLAAAGSLHHEAVRMTVPKAIPVELGPLRPRGLAVGKGQERPSIGDALAQHVSVTYSRIGLPEPYATLE